MSRARSDVDEVADTLLAGVGLLVRRLRQLPTEDQLTMPERTVLARLDRDGPASSAELARQAQITPQSMGSTLAALGARELIERHRDPDDGRRVVVSVTRAGRAVVRAKRHSRSRHLARALHEHFTDDEVRRLAAAAPLLERLGHSL